IPAPPTRARERRWSDHGDSMADAARAPRVALQPATATPTSARPPFALGAPTPVAVGGAQPSAARVEDDLPAVEPARPAAAGSAHPSPARVEDDLRAVEPARPAAMGSAHPSPARAEDDLRAVEP